MSSSEVVRRREQVDWHEQDIRSGHTRLDTQHHIILCHITPWIANPGTKKVRFSI